MSSSEPGTANGTTIPNGAGHPSPAESAESAPNIADQLGALSKQLREVSERYDARIKEHGQQLQRFKNIERMLNDPSHPSQQATSAPSGLTQADLRAAMALERQMVGLPESARRHVESLEEAGASPSEILREVKAIRLGMGADVTSAEQVGVTSAPSKTRERAATAPPRTAVQHPRTLSEYYQLDPESRKKLSQDPTFHPEDLPLRD